MGGSPSVLSRTLKATDFEYHHRTLLHLSVVSVAFLTYLVNPDDVVWAQVRGHSDARLMERVAFAVATLLIGVATVLRTWGRTHGFFERSPQQSVFWRESLFRHVRYPMHVGDVLFAVGLGFLLPLPGSIFLVIAEAILVSRLVARESATDRDSLNLSAPGFPPGSSAAHALRSAARVESGKWGLFFTMVVFTLLLNDRVAEVLGAGSVLLWMGLNNKSFQS